jgi:hypothetical protein
MGGSKPGDRPEEVRSEEKRSGPYEGLEEERRLRETGGWREGLQPGVGRGAELDEALEGAAPDADPAMRPAVPGFGVQPDATEVYVEGGGVARARNARDDLPLQG